MVRSSAARISDLVAKGQNLKDRFHRFRMKRRPFQPPFPNAVRNRLLAEMPPAILAAEPAAGDADKTVAAGVFLAAERGGGDQRDDARLCDFGCAG